MEGAPAYGVYLVTEQQQYWLSSFLLLGMAIVAFLLAHHVDDLFGYIGAVAGAVFLGMQGLLVFRELKKLVLILERGILRMGEKVLRSLWSRSEAKRRKRRQQGQSSE